MAPRQPPGCSQHNHLRRGCQGGVVITELLLGLSIPLPLDFSEPQLSVWTMRRQQLPVWREDLGTPACPCRRPSFASSWLVSKCIYSFDKYYLSPWCVPITRKRDGSTGSYSLVRETKQ